MLSTYREMLEDQTPPIIDDMGITNMWFQQDGATSHKVTEKNNSLHLLL